MSSDLENNPNATPLTPMLQQPGGEGEKADKKTCKQTSQINGSSGGARDSSRPTPSSAVKSMANRSVRAVSSAAGGGLRAKSPLLLFERASPRWWNPQFASPLLESQYWKCSFPQLRERFRYGLVYIVLTSFAWFVYHAFKGDWSKYYYHIMGLAVVVIALGLLAFTYTSQLYQRFYLPTSFFCTFLVCLLSLVIFSLQPDNIISPLGTFGTSVEIVLLLYTVIPLPLYLCVIAGASYSVLFEVLSQQHNVEGLQEYRAVKLALHACVHLLGIHVFILSQVRQRKTFLKVGQSLLARRDLQIEKQFKDHMIQSVMPKSVADELLKESSELRRPSCGPDTGRRVSPQTPASAGSNSGRGSAVSGGARGSTVAAGPLPRFRPFQMNLMTNVSILFADIAGFTKMSSNKSAEELVDLLNDLFGRFDALCGDLGCEKISTLGDCYYCVSGCPEPRPEHASCCVEMGLAMIGAIRKFDRDRGQEVNMRVGIHTGTVMCGIVGTKRFKFDVFSNDVTLANLMESSGMAGRVHISEKTAAFLHDKYTLEEDSVVEGLKTYFIAAHHGGSDDTSAAGSRADDMDGHDATASLADIDAEEKPTVDNVWRDRRNVPKVLAIKVLTQLKSRTHSSSSTNKSASSLRIKLLSGTRPSNQSTKSEGGSDTKKSSSLQVLSVSPTAMSAGHSPSRKKQVGGSEKYLNKDLANGSSGSRSLASLERGESRTSGLVQDHFDTTGRNLDMSAHHGHSLTRFDNDHRDFDKRLADALQNSDLTGSDYWVHRRTLNPLTLTFRECQIEAEYRRRFGGGPPPPGVATETATATTNSAGYGTPRYSVAAEICISTVVHLLVSVAAFAVFGVSSMVWVGYFLCSCVYALTVLTLMVLPLWRHRRLSPCLSLWYTRHAIALLLILLPVGAAFTNLLCNAHDSNKTVAAKQLVAGDVMLVVMFCHVNFSQLASWSKSLQACLVGAALSLLAHACLCQHTYCAPGALFANTSSNLTTQSINNHRNFSDAVFSGTDVYQWEVLLDVLLALVLICFLNYQIEAGFRMSFFGDIQARRDTEQMQCMRDQADWLLTNIIPHHVIDVLKDASKYSKNHDTAAVIFACITNWGDMYEENFEGGREFLRVLNEVVGDFDELLDRPEFNQVEKIKTIGSTYMAAAGLNPEKRRNASSPVEHLCQLMDFSLALQETLTSFNNDLLNFEFRMKIGYNVGPVTAGVIGTTKLYYDIWGDTVNIASRMYSTGVEGRIQVSDRVQHILQDRYHFSLRGHVDVKGIDKGMDVYLLEGHKGQSPCHNKDTLPPP